MLFKFEYSNTYLVDNFMLANYKLMFNYYFYAVGRFYF